MTSFTVELMTAANNANNEAAHVSFFLSLPFAPYPGLAIQVGEDLWSVQDAYWDLDTAQFSCAVKWRNSDKLQPLTWLIAHGWHEPEYLTTHTPDNPSPPLSADTANTPSSPALP